jgi:hypothetical protein
LAKETEALKSVLALPIRQPRLRDQVYESLRDLIRLGRFPESGAVEQDLAA